VEVHVSDGPQQTKEPGDGSDQPTLYWLSITGYPVSTLTLLSFRIESGRSANVWLIADWRDGLEVAVESPRQLQTEEDERTFRRQVMEKIWGGTGPPPPDDWQHVTILCAITARSCRTRFSVRGSCVPARSRNGDGRNSGNDGRG
jgi:hypothetical protein